MFTYDFKQRGGKAVYGPSILLRGISLLFALVIIAGFAMALAEGSLDGPLLIPFLFLLLLLVCGLFRDSWVFDNSTRTVTYIAGIGPFVKKHPIPYDEIERIEVTHFIKGIPATSPEQKTSWKHKAQVVLSIRIDEDTKHDIDILPEDRSAGKLERNASWLSSYTGLDLYVDRPRETRSLYRK
ncbi:MAG: hypothetical protein SPJ34_08560 [Candidatus Ornithospirochaeta sp.]|nr:hypothetical protein [Candidatus Ornithospirochaeta sp.]